MNYSEYKFGTAKLIKKLAATNAQYAKSRKPTPWVDYVAGYIHQRMQREPHRYVEFGPYWWAVKAALAETGRHLGDETDAIVLTEYGPCNPDGTLSVELSLLAGELFKELYAGNFFTGTRDFALKDDGSMWTLVDGNMVDAIEGL